MMVPHRYPLLAGALLLCTGVAGAQAQGEKTSYRRYSGPLSSVDLDLETGVITRGPVLQQRGVNTSSTFPNVDLSGFVGADPIKPAQTGIKTLR